MSTTKHDNLNRVNWTLDNLLYNRSVQIDFISTVCCELTLIDEHYANKLVHLPLIGEPTTIDTKQLTQTRKMGTLSDMVTVYNASAIPKDTSQNKDFYHVKIGLKGYINHLHKLCNDEQTYSIVYVYTVLILLLLSPTLRDIVCANTPMHIADSYLQSYVPRMEAQMWGVCKNIETETDRGVTIIDAQLPIEIALNELMFYKIIVETHKTSAV